MVRHNFKLPTDSGRQAVPVAVILGQAVIFEHFITFLASKQDGQQGLQRIGRIANRNRQ